MLIVLEGCDGVGKSTLVSQIAECIGGDRPVEIIAHGPPSRHPLDEYEGSLLHYVPGGNQHIVVDRLHLGEPIYGPTYRGRDELGRPGVDHVNLFLRSRGAVLAVVTAKQEVVEQRIGVRGDDFVRHDDLGRILGEYQVWLSECQRTMGEDVYRIDTTHLAGRASWSVAGGLVAHAAVLSKRVWPLAVVPSYVGPVQPPYLLVGDEPNPNLTDNLNSLPFSPYGMCSGRYLLQVCEPFMDQIGLVNSKGVDLEQVVDAVQPRHVVALGTAAHERLGAAGVKHRWGVPHPQWWRRFRYHDLEAYRTEIFMEAL